jgi:hypothetical protein
VVSKVLADNRNLTEIYEKGYREFSKLVAEGLTNEWSKLGIFSFFDGPYIDNQEYYLGPNQALLAIAEHSNQSDTAKIFILDSLQPGRLELCDKSGFELFLEKFEEVFPNSEKFYFGPRTSDRTWLHEFQTLKIPFDWIIKRPNVFAEVLTDASPIGEDIGPGDAGFEDFSSMHEVLVSKLGPPSLTEEVLGRIRDGNTSEVAGEAAGLMASLVNPATAVSRGVRYLGRFMTILMDRRKQEVKEVYEEWRNRVKETFKEENLKKFFDEKQEEQKQIIDTIRDGKNVLLILETRETLYDLFYPLVIQHLVEEIGYIPPHRRKRKDPRLAGTTTDENEPEWDNIELRYDEIDESDLPPVTDKLIQRIMQSEENDVRLKVGANDEFEGKPKTTLYIDSATHLSKFKKSFRFALRLPEKYPNIKVAAGFYTSKDSLNKTLQDGVLEFIGEQAYVFDLHPTLFDIVTMNLPISQKARLQGYLQEISVLRENKELTLLEFISSNDLNWRLLSTKKKREYIAKSKEISIFSKIKRRIKALSMRETNQ